MKTALLSVLATLLTSPAFASPAPTDYSRLLVEKDIVRTFWSPCNLTSLQRSLELQEADNYAAQGFVLVAKIKMPPTDEQGSGIPECQYTFVRRANLR